jgi:5'-AMP-activated protein kinase regulatory gamma subunit
MAEDSRAAAELNAVEPPIVRLGHEAALIAQPSTFLLPRGHNRAMVETPLTAVDKDQQQGLVSLSSFAFLLGGVNRDSQRSMLRAVRGV